MSLIKHYLLWLYWYLTGPDTAHLNPGDPREDYVAAHSAWLKREPKQ